ncbi:helix-turn-helix domain-containing protein [Paucibacter sp. hw8]|uniref:Helix-turn-helix domain-containing protein n=1 Tax=Roseateles albus TaxID=2987525 RepID=A0ABT5KEH5_9BURK|nr:helix-turn-helix domain-containing protein [Roseateles albus]
MAALELLGHVTTFEASRCLDIYDPRARKLEIVKSGREVLTQWRRVETESGKAHRIGVYSLARGHAIKPTKGDALAGGAAQGIKVLRKADRYDSTSASTDRKAFATIQAELALKGYGLEQLEGALFITRWDLFRKVHTLEGAARFLAQIGGAA